MAVALTSTLDGVIFAVKVVPGASRSRVVGEYDSGLKVTVAPAAEAGAANKAVIALLAQTLGLPKARIQITKGHTSPKKSVLLRDLDPATAETLLARLI